MTNGLVGKFAALARLQKIVMRLKKMMDSLLARQDFVIGCFQFKRKLVNNACNK